MGLARGEVSEIHDWLETCIPRLGAKRTFSVIRDVRSRDRVAAYRTWYWAKILLLEADPDIAPELEEFERGFAKPI
jgi:hypothetical protein